MGQPYLSTTLHRARALLSKSEVLTVMHKMHAKQRTMISRKKIVTYLGIVLALIGILILASPGIAESSPLCTYQESYQTICTIPSYFYILQILGLPVIGVAGILLAFAMRQPHDIRNSQTPWFRFPLRGNDKQKNMEKSHSIRSSAKTNWTEWMQPEGNWTKGPFQVSFR